MSMILAAPAAPPSTTAAAPALPHHGWVDIDYDRAVTAHCLVQGKTHESETAGANDHRRLGFQGRDLFQRAKGGDTGASERGAQAEDRRYRTGSAGAVPSRSPRTRRSKTPRLRIARQRFSSPRLQGSQVPHPIHGCASTRSPTLTPLACGPSATTSPTFSWTESNGQLHAPVGKTQALAAAGRNNLPTGGYRYGRHGRQNLQQNFAAGRLRRWLFVELQGLAANTNLEHTHRTLSRVFSFSGRQRTTVRSPRH